MSSLNPVWKPFPLLKKWTYLRVYAAVRSKNVSKRQGRGGAGGMAKSDIDNLAVSIAESGWTNPDKDYEGNTLICIVCQVCSVKFFDKNSTVKSPPVTHLQLSLWFVSNTARSKVIAKLLWGVLFFAMSSCEYTLSNINYSNRRTITFHDWDIKSFKHDIKLPPSSSSSLFPHFCQNHSSMFQFPQPW